MYIFCNEKKNQFFKGNLIFRLLRNTLLKANNTQRASDIVTVHTLYAINTNADAE